MNGYVIQSRLYSMYHHRSMVPSAMRGPGTQNTQNICLNEAALQLLTGQHHNGVLTLNDPLILKVLFMMLSELSTLLLNLFDGNVFYYQ